MVSETLPPIIPAEDFWARQANAPRASFELAPLGMPVTITANRPELLTAGRLSAPRFSRLLPPGESPVPAARPARIHLVLRPMTDEPVPDDLPQRLVYSGTGHWITVSAGIWGYGFASLQEQEAVVILSPALAAQSRLVSRYFVDHYLLNFILNDWAMLHASCLLDHQQQRLLVMIAPHNIGKSTTALLLLRAGYTFLADGMALFQWDSAHRHFLVGGYPVGEVKLRDDVLNLFPEYNGETVKVREQHKTVIDLRSAHPERLAETVVRPGSIELCFVERGFETQTRLTPLSLEEALARLATNTVYWDKAEHLTHNTATLHHLLHYAGRHRLILGSDRSQLIAAISQLFADHSPGDDTQSGDGPPYR